MSDAAFSYSGENAKSKHAADKLGACPKQKPKDAGHGNGDEDADGERLVVQRMAG
jgi:hypothetical protein